MPKKGYKTVTIPEDLYEMIKKIIAERRELGYNNVSEFVRDAIRSKLRELGYIRKG